MDTRVQTRRKKELTRRCARASARPEVQGESERERERERERREKLNLESKHAVHSFLIYNAEEKAPVSQQQHQQNIPMSSAHIPASVKVCSEPTSNPVRTYRRKTLVRMRVFSHVYTTCMGKKSMPQLLLTHTDTQWQRGFGGSIGNLM